MRVRFIFNSFFPKLFGAEAITLYPFIFFSQPERESVEQCVVQHEMVHVEQVRKMGWLTMYWTYVADYLRLRLQGLDHWQAATLLPLEFEAYERQRDPALYDAYILELQKA